jgi:hypothetical protein
LKGYKAFQNAEIAQPVEQGTENPRVPSSILGLGTLQNFKKELIEPDQLLFYLLKHMYAEPVLF